MQELLGDCRAIIEDADWDQLRQALQRIEGPPNNARKNLDNVIALIPEARTATRVQELSADLYEYLRRCVAGVGVQSGGELRRRALGNRRRHPWGFRMVGTCNAL